MIYQDNLTQEDLDEIIGNNLITIFSKHMQMLAQPEEEIMKTKEKLTRLFTLPYYLYID